MRAMMSRDHSYRLSAEIYGDTTCGLLAEREARAILAETEPRQEQGKGGWWFKAKPNRQWDGSAYAFDEAGFYSGTAWQGHLALAESLTAFLTLDLN